MRPRAKRRCQPVAMETVVPDTLATASAGMNQQNIVLPSELDTEMKKCKEGERGPAHDGQEGG